MNFGFNYTIIPPKMQAFDKKCILCYDEEADY